MINDNEPVFVPDLSKLIETGPPMWAIDSNRRVTYLNPAALRMMGYQLSEIQGQPI